MQEEPQKPNYRDDEIDLRAVFQSIGNFFVRIGNGILNLILGIRRITFRYKVLIIILAILGGIVAGGFKTVSDPFYESTLVLRSNYFNGRFIENSIDKLNRLCSPLNYPELAKILKIDVDIAEKILGFESNPFVSEEELIELELLKAELQDLKIDQVQIDNITRRIEIENKRAFEITVRTSDSEVIETLEPPIINYFKENPFIKKRIEINMKNLLIEKAKLEQDIEQIDSLKTVIFEYIQSTAQKSREGSNNVVLSDPSVSDPINVFREGITTTRQKLRTDTRIYLEDDFELLDGFTPFQTPASAGMITVVLYGILIGIGLAYIIIFLTEFNIYLNRFEARETQASNIDS